MLRFLRAVRYLFLLAAFVSSALLFVVEPMAAKVILPTFGGTPQVWNTALLFFQTALLLGYLYAHLSAKRVAGRAQRSLHLLVFAAAAVALPFSLRSTLLHQIQTWATEGRAPIPLVLAALAGLIGLPFFALSANSSTLQRWYSMSGKPDAHEPWFLYAAGNLGSMLALLAYPTVIEPFLTLGQQARFWSFGYLALLVLLAACAITKVQGAKVVPEALIPETEAGIPAVDESMQAPAVEPVTRKLRLMWLALAAVPSSLLMGVTTYLTTNIAPVPLLWVIPLALYLLTFILVFAKRPITPVVRLARIYPLVLTPLVLAIVLEQTSPPLALLHLAVVFIAMWMCHSRLALLKPSAEHLTEFFLFVSIGGVVGGVFNALIAPITFDTLAEYPIALVGAALLMPKRKDLASKPIFDAGYPAMVAGIMMVLVFLARLVGLEAGALRTFLTIGIPVILCFLAVDSPTRFGLSLAAGFLVAAGLGVNSDGSIKVTSRSFFGVHRVESLENGRVHRLSNGNTIHGQEDFSHPGTPLTYYYPSGPIGQVMTMFKPQTAAFVGLGVGSLAAYGQPGQRFTYYEIDPVVRSIATNPKWFTFLRDTKANVNIVMGDARLEMSKSSSAYDLIVLDAFSSDAIPVHLLTEEAIQMYLKHLNQDGMLAFHISNRYLDLQPILSAAARDLHLTAYVWEDDGVDEDEKKAGKQPSIWVVMARTITPLKRIKLSWWNELEPTTRRAWTDDYSNVLGAFKGRDQ